VYDFEEPPRTFKRYTVEEQRHASNVMQGSIRE